MRGPGRNRKPGRRQPFRDLKPTVLIFCEGEKTERQYFEKFAHQHRNSLIRVEVVKKTGVPLPLVKNAIEYKKENETQAKREKDPNIAYDSVWCVFDVDNHPRVAEAKKLANDNKIQVAISNPCFELWLVLHFQESPGKKSCRQFQSLLKNLDPSYANDSKSVDFSKYAPGYDQAVERAKRLDAIAQTAGTPGDNPTTNVYELTELILKGSTEAAGESSVAAV